MWDCLFAEDQDRRTLVPGSSSESLFIGFVPPWWQGWRNKCYLATWWLSSTSQTRVMNGILKHTGIKRFRDDLFSSVHSKIGELLFPFLFPRCGTSHKPIADGIQPHRGPINELTNKPSSSKTRNDVIVLLISAGNGRNRKPWSPYSCR
jgi:hypothetical protein